MYKRVMVVVDRRPVAKAAVAEGVELARVHGAEVLFFTAMPLYPMPLADVPPFVVVPPKEYQEAADEEARRLLAAARAVADKAGVHARVAKGDAEDPARSIADAARRRHCDVIVVASAGRNALLRLLTGSVIPALITASPIPVLICKQRARSPHAPRVARKAAAPAKPRKTAVKRLRATTAA